MMIPGDDLLEMALDVIDSQIPLLLIPFVSASTDGAGMQALTYSTIETPIKGSVQAVDRTMYKDLQLDRSKNYVMLYTSTPVKTVQRDTYGDHIRYNGILFRAENNLDWMAQDSWNGILCIQIPEVRKTIAGPMYG